MSEQPERLPSNDLKSHHDLFLPFLPGLLRMYLLIMEGHRLSGSSARAQGESPALPEVF